MDDIFFGALLGIGACFLAAYLISEIDKEKAESFQDGYVLGFGAGKAIEAPKKEETKKDEHKDKPVAGKTGGAKKGPGVSKGAAG